MKAIVYTKYGGPEVLQLQDVPTPVPKDDEVLIKVHAVSLNDWDYGLLQDDLFNRMMSGLKRPRRTIVGSDVAGRIEAVGKNVQQFKPGDEVYGDLSGRWGGLAEYVCAQEKKIIHKPSGMSYVDAAAIPQAGMLAVQGLIDVGEIRQGQKILINGAGGGVGTFGIQLAKLYGADVTGVDRTEKLAMMLKLGFHHVIDYTKEDFTKNGQQYDLILDAKTTRSIFDYTRVLAPKGKYVTVGGSIPKLLQALLLKRWIWLTRKKYIRIVILKPNKDLPYLNELYTAGKFMPVIDGPYKLEETQAAFRHFGAGQHKGKIVITI